MDWWVWPDMQWVIGYWQGVIGTLVFQWLWRARKKRNEWSVISGLESEVYFQKKQLVKHKRALERVGSTCCEKCGKDDSVFLTPMQAEGEPDQEYVDRVKEGLADAKEKKLRKQDVRLKIPQQHFTGREEDLAAIKGAVRKVVADGVEQGLVDRGAKDEIEIKTYEGKVVKISINLFANRQIYFLTFRIN